MTTRVNLLPADMQRHRIQRCRRRLWITLCVTAIAVQAGALFVANMRAQEVRLAKARAVRLAKSLTQEKSERDGLRSKADNLAAELKTAERLREKHLWSRWFASLGLIVPSQVVLTEVRTEPSRFSGAGNVIQAGVGASEDKSGVRSIRISGAAVEHQDLINLLEQLNGTRMFRSVTIEQARRDRLGNREVIGFTLVCEW